MHTTSCIGSRTLQNPLASYTYSLLGGFVPSKLVSSTTLDASYKLSFALHVQRITNMYNECVICPYSFGRDSRCQVETNLIKVPPKADVIGFTHVDVEARLDFCHYFARDRVHPDGLLHPHLHSIHLRYPPGWKWRKHLCLETLVDVS